MRACAVAGTTLTPLEYSAAVELAARGKLVGKSWGEQIRNYVIHPTQVRTGSCSRSSGSSTSGTG